MSTVTIAVEVMRSNLLSANGRESWQVRHRATGVLRWTAFAAWRAAGAPRMQQAHAVCEVAYPDRRRRDAHNYYRTAKALIDGMVSGPQSAATALVGHLLLPDDSDAYLVGPDMRAAAHTTGKPGRFVFTFTFIELDDAA